MRRYIDAAVLLRAGQSEHVVIFIDSAAHRAERVMTVGQHIGHRELLKTGSSGRLDDSHKSNVMRGQFIEFYLKFIHIAGSIVGFQNPVGNGVLPGVFFADRQRRLSLFHNITAIDQINAAVV